eukprot:gene15391-24554_t
MLQVCTASLEEYREMAELEPFWAPVFVACFFVSVWLVLLNVIIGIVNQSFSTVASSTSDATWSLSSIKQEWHGVFQEDSEEVRGCWNTVCGRASP